MNTAIFYLTMIFVGILNAPLWVVQQPPDMRMSCELVRVEGDTVIIPRCERPVETTPSGGSISWVDIGTAIQAR